MFRMMLIVKLCATIVYLAGLCAGCQSRDDNLSKDQGKAVKSESLQNGLNNGEDEDDVRQHQQRADDDKKEVRGHQAELGEDLRQAKRVRTVLASRVPANAVRLRVRPDGTCWVGRFPLRSYEEGLKWLNTFDDLELANGIVVSFEWIPGTVGTPNVSLDPLCRFAVAKNVNLFYQDPGGSSVRVDQDGNVLPDPVCSLLIRSTKKKDRLQNSDMPPSEENHDDPH